MGASYLATHHQAAETLAKIAGLTGSFNAAPGGDRECCMRCPDEPASPPWRFAEILARSFEGPIVDVPGNLLADC